MISNELNLEQLNNLSSEEKALALEILKELSKEGHSEILDDLKYSDFEEIPVDIMTFISEDKYLGRGLYITDEYTGERKCTVFPYWIKTLQDIFPDNLTTKYNTLILTGSIGLGKSFVAVVCQLYLLYRMMCLKDPYAYYGMQPIDKITFSMLNVTLEAAQGVGWDKMQQLLQSSDWFMARGNMNASRTNPQWQPPKGIELVFGSSNRHVVGRALFCLEGDTVIKTTDGEYKIKDLVDRPIQLPTMSDSGSTLISDVCTAKPTILSDEEIEIELADSTVIKCTPNHKFMLIDGTYKEAQYLTEDDELMETPSTSLEDTYAEFISRIIKTRGQWNIPEGEYFEGHHILPKCLGGEGASKKKDYNVIWLYPEEHYQAHKLLALENPTNPKLVYAWSMMVFPKGKTNRHYEISAEDYGQLKRLQSEILKKNNPGLDADRHPWNYGKKEISQKGGSTMKIKSIKHIHLKQPKQYYDIINANPFNNFFIKTNDSYIVSHNCNFSDEVNFGIGNNVEKQKTKLKKMISQIDARMISRFGKGTYLPTMNIIASSKDSEQAFMESYIEMKRQNESKTTLIIDEPQWVVRNDKGSPDDPGSFYVAIGNKFLAHELLPVNVTEQEVDAYREKGYSMLKVPPIYREAFEDNLDLALTDNAGISTASSIKYISGIRLNQIKTDTYQNLFTKDVIEVGNSPEDRLQYANFFDLSRVTAADKARPLFIHLDMSTGGSGNGDKTGIAGIWITGKRPPQDGQSSGKELDFKLAFSVSIKAPKGFQISFEKNRNFIRWLKDVGFAVKGVSSDTYQSAQIQQQLKADGFHAEIISVDRVDKDRVCKPYAFLKSAIYERQLKMYKKCDLLTDELTSLERLSDGHIDHPKNFSKDQADAACGALYLASKFADEYSYSYGENLNATLAVNGILSDEDRKHQMIADFQKELTKVYFEMDQAQQHEQEEQRKEYQRYSDILDGIIVI